MEKGLFIKDIADGQLVEGLYLVRQMSRAETKTGKPYLALTIMDRSGELAARIWEDADRYMEICRAGSIVFLSAQAQAYKSVLQLKINDVEPVDDATLDLSLFLPATQGDIEQMAKEVLALAASIADPYLRKLLLSFFQSKALLTAFKKAPAAKFMHHAYIGGLLEHTLGVARLADAICALYADLDRSMLLAAALLHDVGKVAEFSFDVFPFDYSVRGRLVGHMVLGIEMIQNRINTLPDFPEEIFTRLSHLILSHHGRHEFGSPVLPMIREAFVLNFLDELDSKINYFNRLGEQAQGDEYQWSDYQKNLERFLYVKAPGADQINQRPDYSDGSSSGKANNEEIDPRQTTLWKS